MATDKKFIEAVLDKLQHSRSRRTDVRRIRLYYRGKNFALVCDNTLFVKITEAVPRKPDASARARLRRAKPAYRISSAKLNDRDWIISLVTATSDALPLPKKKGFRVRP